MPTTLKWYHWTLSLVIISFCLLIIVEYGWLAFATITEQPGLNGNIHSYYNLTKLQYAAYVGLVAIAGLYIICYVTFYLIKADTSNLKKVFWRFLVFLVLIIACEVYLQTRFVGKG